MTTVSSGLLGLEAERGVGGEACSCIEELTYGNEDMRAGKGRLGRGRFLRASIVTLIAFRESGDGYHPVAAAV